MQSAAVGQHEFRHFGVENFGVLSDAKKATSHTALRCGDLRPGTVFERLAWCQQGLVADDGQAVYRLLVATCVYDSPSGGRSAGP